MSFIPYSYHSVLTYNAEPQTKPHSTVSIKRYLLTSVSALPLFWNWCLTPPKKPKLSL